MMTFSVNTLIVVAVGALIATASYTLADHERWPLAGGIGIEDSTLPTPFLLQHSTLFLFRSTSLFLMLNCKILLCLYFTR
eukprot:m.45880 g.45880  ORF g.45880 m.45880 type:complete len:80 (+) comp10700_c0_seq1:156-395(+)